MITTAKTTVTTQGKSTTTRNNAYKKIQSPSPARMFTKIHHIGLQGKSKPGQQEQHEFCKTKLSSKFFQIKKYQNLIGGPRGIFGVSVNLSVTVASTVFHANNYVCFDRICLSSSSAARMFTKIHHIGLQEKDGVYADTLR